MENEQLNEEQKFFSTRDLYLASSLVTLGFFVTNIDFQIEGEKRRPVGYFEFENTPELKEAGKKFWTGQLLIEPRSFVTSMRGLKSQVENVYQSPNSEFNR